MVTTESLKHPAKRRSAHDLVTHGIGQSIVQGRFPPNSMLPGEAELMEFYGVSRTALREALKTLAAKGLIESKTKVGTRILDRTSWNMFDSDILEWHLELGADAQFLGWLLEIRQTLEPLACATAAKRRSSKHLDEMRRALNAMHGSGRDREGFTKADLAFHQAILAASGNPFLQSIGSVTAAALATAFTISSPVSSDEQFEHVMQQHQAVFDAIESGDSSAASDAMSALILQAGGRTRIKADGNPLANVQIHAFSKGGE